jgi:hypothetical protein
MAGSTISGALDRSPPDTHRGWIDVHPRQLRRAVEMAARAPSLHNSQPWHWVAGGDTIELWAARTRALPVIDGAGRELEISCGAALQNLVVALVALGREPHAVLRPDPTMPDLLATVDVSREGAPTVAQLLMAHAIPLRRSNRHPFTDETVDGAVLCDLLRIASSQGAWALLLDEEDRVELAVLIQEAEQTARLTEGYLEELDAWTTRDPERDDGVPLAEVPDDASPAGIAVRAFDPASVGAPGRRTDLAPVLVLLGTDGDDPAAHLRAGRALAAMLLHVETAGLSASLHSQPLELASSRSRLQRRAGSGAPQVLIRIGHCDQPGSLSRRRPIGAILTIIPEGCHVRHPHV